MVKIVTTGPTKYVLRSWASLIGVSVKVAMRRLFRGPLAPNWPADFEIANIFWRGQFESALAMEHIEEGRRYFDSLQTYTDEVFDVQRAPAEKGGALGDWITPLEIRTPATLLYLHGGGYTFHAGVSARYAEMLAALLGARLFALDYRLTPEHPHPAQLEDAVKAYEAILGSGVEPEQIVLIGDSAGGHLCLMTLQSLRERGLPQPALAIGLCPWTDIGARGDSLFGNDRYDLVQGHMALRFGEWLVGDSGLDRVDLSPVEHNFAGLAPLYLQGGGREILIDMICDFARLAGAQGAEVVLDVWPDMTHNFQAAGLTRKDSAEAIARIRSAIAHYVEAGAPELVSAPTTVAYHRARGS